MRVSDLSVYGIARFAALSSLTFLLVTAPYGLRAQDASDPPQPPRFAQLFLQPSGQNGYEDWTRAADLMQNNARLDSLLDPDATLTTKRRVLDEPNVSAALHLLHAGLAKPIQSPQSTDNLDILLPQYFALRNLARLLHGEIYVQFADGRVDAAIDTLDDGLRFGCRMQTDTLDSGFVGLDAQTIVLNSFSPRLDQLSQYQCRRVQHIVEEIIAQPSPLPALLRAEQKMMERRLDAFGADPKGKENMVNEFARDEDMGENTRLVITHVRSNPVDAATLVAQVKTRAEAYYSAAIADVGRPRKQRKSLPPPANATLDGRLFNIIMPSLQIVDERYSDMDARIRLLGVHAAIRAYRWEHNRLPQTLTELRLGDLALDPHTGDMLRYENKGATYDLFSRGAAPLDANGKPTDDAPVPVRL